MQHRLLIGTLYCGENEWSQSQESLRAQTFTNWISFVVEHRPNKEAHDTLYLNFMQHAGEYTHFLKLDADMVLCRPTALEDSLAVFDSQGGLDHLMLDVRDWYTDSLLPGIQMFTNRARWKVHADGLMVDPPPEVPGQRLRLDAFPAPIVDHSPDPSPLQAFRFGVHRMLKALQPDRPLAQRELQKARVQWDIVKGVWRNFLQKGDPRLGLAVLGADWVLREGGMAIGYEYSSRAVGESIFPEFARLAREAIQERLRPRWQDERALDAQWREWLQSPD